ncbi:MAG: DUF1189 family protein [Weeksellaceae bacterium]
MKTFKQKLKTFWYTLKNSLFSTAYYADILKAPFSFSAKYLYVLIFFTVLINSLFLAIGALSVLPEVPAMQQKITARLNTLYPENLIVKLENGSLATNSPEPVFIDIPEFQEDTEFQHVITIDTQAQIEDYQSYKTVVLFTEKAIVYPPERGDDTGIEGAYTVRQYEPTEEPIVIDESVYNQFVTAVKPFIKAIPAILVSMVLLLIFIVPFIFSFIVFIWKLFYLLIATVVVKGIAMIFKVPYTYQQLYQLGMHALTIPIMLTFLMQLFVIVPPFMLYTAAFMLWMVIVLNKLSKERS